MFKRALRSVVICFYLRQAVKKDVAKLGRPAGVEDAAVPMEERRPQSVVARWEGNVREGLRLKAERKHAARDLESEPEPEPEPAEREQPSVAQLESQF